MTRDQEALSRVLRQGSLKCFGDHAVTFTSSFFLHIMLQAVAGNAGENFTIETACEALDQMVNRCEELKTALKRERELVT